MGTVDLKFSDDTTQQITLSTVNGVTNIPVVFNGSSTDVPFERFVLADESVVFIFVLTAFISSGLLLNQNPTKFRFGYGLNKHAMVTPVRNSGGDVWNFQYQIRFSNDQSSYSIIEVISGELPPGLNVDSTSTSGDRTTISGKVNDSAFGLNTWQNNVENEHSFENASYNTTKLEILDVNYIESVSDNPTIISNPTNTFTQGSTIQNMKGDSRIIESISTYQENGVTKTKIVVPYVAQVYRNGYSEYETFDLPRNEVIENGKLTSKKDPNFKAFVNLGEDIYAYYTDTKTVVEASGIDSQSEKDYVFTLGIRSPDSPTYHAQQQFTIRVKQNFDNVRDNFQALNNYPPVDVFYDPTQNVYVVNYVLSLLRANGSSTTISLDDGVLKLDSTREIEAFGELFLRQNISGVRTDSNITLTAGE